MGSCVATVGGAHLPRGSVMPAKRTTSALAHAMALWTGALFVIARTTKKRMRVSARFSRQKSLDSYQPEAQSFGLP